MKGRWAWPACLGLLVACWSFAGGTGCFSNCDLKIQTDALPAGSVGVEYRFNLDSKCGGDSWFVNDGTLPPGISLQSDGDFRGTPTVPGIFNFTVGLVDFRSGDEAFKGFQLVVTALPLPTPTATP